MPRTPVVPDRIRKPKGLQPRQATSFGSDGHGAGVEAGDVHAACMVRYKARRRLVGSAERNEDALDEAAYLPSEVVQSPEEVRQLNGVRVDANQCSQEMRCRVPVGEVWWLQLPVAHLLPKEAHGQRPLRAREDKEVVAASGVRAFVLCRACKSQS